MRIRFFIYTILFDAYGEYISITLIFGFGYDCEFDLFSQIAEQNFTQTGNADIEWPEYLKESGFTAGTVYEIPVEIKMNSSFDKDSIGYMLKKFRKQVEEVGINLGLLEIREEG